MCVCLCEAVSVFLSFTCASPNIIIHPRKIIFGPISSNQDFGSLNFQFPLTTASPHQKNLKDLCRVCKSKGAVTLKFQCLKWRTIGKRTLRKFTLNISLTHEHILTKKLLGYLHGWRITTTVAVSVPMQQKLRKVEDLKRQEGEDRDPSRTQNPGLNPLQDLDALAKDLPSLRFADFSEKFSFPESLGKDLVCQVCIQILNKPVESICQPLLWQMHERCNGQWSKQFLSYLQGENRPSKNPNSNGAVTHCRTRSCLSEMWQERTLRGWCCPCLRWHDCTSTCCNSWTAHGSPWTSTGSPADYTGCPSMQIFTRSRENLHRSREKKMKDWVAGKTVLFKTVWKVFCFFISSLCNPFLHGISEWTHLCSCCSLWTLSSFVCHRKQSRSQSFI